jgi:L,D-transpeptidase YcbB
VDDPFGFAAVLLGEPASRDSLNTLRETNPDTQRLALAEPLPVIVGYFTAEVADDGTLRLFDDVYKLDRGSDGAAPAGDDCSR